jgi:hypothetical protein
VVIRYQRQCGRSLQVFVYCKEVLHGAEPYQGV